MCGFNDSRHSPVSSDLLVEQFRNEFRKYAFLEQEIAVDLYTSGSFLDENELDARAREEILQIIFEDGRVRELLIESRPEYITRHKLQAIKRGAKDTSVVVAIGLESSSDFIRTYCINKGFTFEDFKKAANIVREFCELAIYLLMKPPFLTESEAIEDILASTKDVEILNPKYIIVMPNHVQRSTLTFILWERGQYRPPWLWSLVYLIRTCGDKAGFRIGGFSLTPEPIDSPRNCGECDAEVINMIKAYNRSGKRVNSIPCICLEEWGKEIRKTRAPLLARLVSYYRTLGREFGVSEDDLNQAISDLQNSVFDRGRLQLHDALTIMTKDLREKVK